MTQQGQVFRLKARGEDGQLLWAYRYRLDGPGSLRPQVGGFATRAEAQKALRKVLDRLGPGGRGATMTLGELVVEYLEMHQVEPVTISKLRWLLRKATAVLGEVRLADLLPERRRQRVSTPSSVGASPPSVKLMCLSTGFSCLVSPVPRYCRRGWATGAVRRACQKPSAVRIVIRKARQKEAMAPQSMIVPIVEKA